MGACLAYFAGYGDGGSAEDVGDLGVAETGGVVFEGEMLFGFIEAEAAQAVGVGEFAEQTELFLGERGLQFVRDFHECHARNYTSPRKGFVRRRLKPQII